MLGAGKILLGSDSIRTEAAKAWPAERDDMLNVCAV